MTENEVKAMILEINSWVDTCHGVSLIDCAEEAGEDTNQEFAPFVKDTLLAAGQIEE
jgi:hypothetical protein